MSHSHRRSLLFRAIVWTHCAALASALAPAAAVPPGSGVAPEIPAGTASTPERVRKVMPAPGALAVLPGFQPGLWEFRRTVTSAGRNQPQGSTVKKCSDPSREIGQKLTELKQKGCQYSPLRARGNRYMSTWTCPAPGGDLVVIRSVVTVRSRTSYQDDNEIHAGSKVSRTTVVATRLGSCSDSMGTQTSGTTSAHTAADSAP